MIQTADITIFYTIPEEEEPPLYLGNVAEKSNLSFLATAVKFLNFVLHHFNYDDGPPVFS
jgi:hypothetical protein